MKAERAVRSLLVLGILVICGIAVVPRSGFAEQGSGGSAADFTQKLRVQQALALQSGSTSTTTVSSPPLTV